MKHFIQGELTAMCYVLACDSVDADLRERLWSELDQSMYDMPDDYITLELQERSSHEHHFTY